MRPGWSPLLRATLVAPVLLLVVTLGSRRVAGDEPGLLGRLFRFGGNAPTAPSPPSPAPSPMPTPTTPNFPITGTPPIPDASYPVSSAPTSEASTPSVPGSPVTPRIIPRPRVARPVTESDPIVTRITINRSDDGNQFGMFLQVFADGTIIDSEGVHHVGHEALRPLVEALQSGELARVKGHCGAPATDFVESVHVVVYERSLGRLRANAFSYSGNPQGCDNAIRNLHALLDNLQAKISRPMSPGGASPVATPTAPPPTGGSQTIIPLTPAN